MSQSRRHDQTLFTTPARWLVRGLVWVAMLLSAYLAWTSLGNQPIAGCAGAGLFDCDVVHNSAWSVWFGLPVAMVGLGCYAALAGLSVLLDWPAPRVGRWVNTLFVLLSVVAGGAALWFIALQLFVIGAICLACTAIHACGIAAAILALAATLRQSCAARSAGVPSAGLATLRTALPTAASTVRPASRPYDGTPAVGVAAGGATAMLALLIGGQVLFQATTFSVATVELDQPIAIGGSGAAPSATQTAAAEPASQPHVALRVGSEAARSPTPYDGDSRLAAEEQQQHADGDDPLFDAGDPAVADKPQPGRELKLLQGKLTLDISEHPLLGSPEAPHVVVEMISYDCQHCRRMHRITQVGRERYGDQLAVVVLPVPLDKACNKHVTHSSPAHQGSCALARFAIAVAAIDPAAFEEFHEWLMEDEEKAPPIRDVSTRAYRLVDRDRLRQFAYSEEMNRRINDNVELFAALQKQHRATNRNFGLPVQIVRNGVISGAARSADAIFATWEEHLEIEPL